MQDEPCRCNHKDQCPDKKVSAALASAFLLLAVLALQLSPCIDTLHCFTTHRYEKYAAEKPEAAAKSKEIFNSAYSDILDRLNELTLVRHSAVIMRVNLRALRGKHSLQSTSRAY